MRLLTLYLRSRRVPAAVAVVVLGTAALTSLAQLGGGATAHSVLAVLAIAVSVAVMGPGLAGADLDLDRTAGLAWPPRRVAHVVVAAVGIAGVVAAASLIGDSLADGRVILRDTLGLGGLTALGAATVGAQRAWIAPVAWSVAVVPVGASSRTWYAELFTWLLQPAGTASATVVASVLAVLGTAAYAAAGSRR